MNPFANWTPADVAAFNARVHRENRIETDFATVVQPVEDESDLHRQILQACKFHGWIPFHGSTAHRTRRTIGEFDFQILANAGRVFLVECKTRTGKLTPEQYALHHWASNLGHSPRVVRSLAEFEEIVK